MRKNLPTDMSTLTDMIATYRIKKSPKFGDFLIGLLGKSNKVMSRELGINLRTVEHHRSNMLRKLDATSLADLIKIEKSGG